MQIPLPFSIYTCLNRCLVSISLLLTVFTLQAAEVTPERAARVAAGFYSSLAPDAQAELSGITLVYTLKEQDAPCLYIFNTGMQGFVMIAAEDEVYPVLGYSQESSWGLTALPPALEEWISGYRNQILLIRSESLTSDASVQEAWHRYDITGSQGAGFQESTVVGPLLTSKWDQGTYYNALCPADGMGPSGRALAGCVAVAMSQVMFYYRYPETGIGSSSYNHWSYGSLSANYGATSYRWEEMGNSSVGKSHLAISELLYHAGVSVEMDYGPSSSGAYSHTAAQSLKSHFGYDPSLTLVYKSSYSDYNWAALLRTNLDAGNPMYYHGFGSGGHAFNVDGYQNNDHFHFNWGWGGSYDGYFYVSSLHPGSNDFTSGQGAIINFKPPVSQYPSFCNQHETITGMAGTLEDGSGPVANYQPMAECKWLLQPSTLTDHITLTFNRFSTETGNDVLLIYDGASEAAPLLATLSGDSVWPTLNSTGGALFLKFISNGTVNKQGWLISYEAFPQVFCTNLQLHTSAAGSFDDGSGTNPYNNNSNCKFLIDPPSGNNQITVTFNAFSLEDGKDFLRIYDPTTTPTTMLAMYTGNTIPQDVTAVNGQMLIIFFTDDATSDSGWELTYSSTVGTPEPAEDDFALLPNPASSTVTLRYPADQQPVLIRIFDITGKCVMHEVPNTGTQTLFDVAILPEGLYIARIEGAGYLHQKKLIIRK